jgi:hypothetical protein
MDLSKKNRLFSEVKLILYSERLAKKEEKSLWECYINQFGQPLLWIKKSFPPGFENILSLSAIGTENVYFIGGIKTETNISKEKVKEKLRTKIFLKAINECYLLDGLKEKIRSLKSMKKTRILHGAAIIDNKIYVVEGYVNKKKYFFLKSYLIGIVLIFNFTTFRMTKSFEVYDSANNDWKFLNKSMNLSLCNFVSKETLDNWRINLKNWSQ